MGEIPPWVLSDLTPWGIVGALVLGLLTGRFIVPKYYYLDMKNDRDSWRSTAKSLEESVGVFADALPDALEVAKTADKVLTAISNRSEESS